jgi:hypothetical protein
MTLKCQIPYNFNYNNTLFQYLSDYRHIIDSVYFGFSNGSRPIKKNSRDLKYHLTKLAKIKNILGIKLVYVLNSVIPIEIGDSDKEILSSGIVDVVTIARDEVYVQVQSLAKRYNLNFEYEVSRFYNYIHENQNNLIKSANFIMYGFEHEIQKYLTLKNDNEGIKFGYIVNEHCYPMCDKKLQHNSNVILRNLGQTDEKFSCPYKEKRILYTTKEIKSVCLKYPVEILKLCDRTMSDGELLNIFEKWFPFTEKINNPLVMSDDHLKIV